MAKVFVSYSRKDIEFAKKLTGELQKGELVKGSDWNPEHVHVGGIPSYDGYFRKQWLMPRNEYFKLHGLDPKRKLISYASSFVHFAPNYPNIEALAKLVSSDSLAEPSQLLIRLHPSHFQDKPKIFADEPARVFELEKKYPNVHVVQPVAPGLATQFVSAPTSSSILREFPRDLRSWLISAPWTATTTGTRSSRPA